jgi:hypothetical protein
MSRAPRLPEQSLGVITANDADGCPVSRYAPHILHCRADEPKNKEWGLVLLPTIAALSKTRRTEFSMRSSALRVKLEPKPNSLLIFKRPKRKPSLRQRSMPSSTAFHKSYLWTGTIRSHFYTALSPKVYMPKPTKSVLNWQPVFGLFWQSSRIGWELRFKDHAELNTAVSRLIGSKPKNAPLQQAPSKVRVDPKTAQLEGSRRRRTSKQGNGP